MICRLIRFIVGPVVLLSCGERQSVVFRAPPPESSTAGKNEAVATFAEGCYWHTEIVFQSLQGVRDAVSGFAGGAESVNVFYDSTKISFQTLVDAFFASHDPTQVNRQGQDVGPQYRSVGFYRTPSEKAVIETAITKLTNSGKYPAKLATQVLPLSRFEEADDDQQEYVAQHPDQLYVKYYNIPDYIKFRKSFSGPFKDSLVVK